MPSPTLVKIAGVAGACACVGAGAGILGGANAASPAAGTGQSPARQQSAGPLRRAVHADAVVPAGHGRFVDVTLDRGILKSINGPQLTIQEGTPKAVYKTVTLTIPANASIRVNGQPSQLSALKPGQRVVVFHGPMHTRVRAHDRRTP